MVLAMRLNLERLARWSWGLWGSLLGGLAVVFLVGSAIKGSNRWIDIGPFNLQPSEMGKVAIAIVLAGIAVDRLEDVGTARFTLFLTAVAGVPAIVVFLQPDLGTSLVYGAVLATILFLVGVPWSHFAVAGSIMAIMVLAVLWVLPNAGVKVLQDYQVERLTAFIGAERDSSDAGYQLDQSKTAIGSGRRGGQGPRRRHPVVGQLHPRAPHRLHLRGHRRDVRVRRGSSADPALCPRALEGPADDGPRLEPGGHAGGRRDRRDDRLPGLR